MRISGLQLGLSLTVPRWYTFDPNLELLNGGLDSAISWDALRMQDPTGSFGMAESPAAWRTRALSDPRLRRRAEVIRRIMQGWSASSLVSVGVGNGMLEFVLTDVWRDLRLRCGEYAPRTLSSLRERFPEGNPELMDLQNPVWVLDPDEVVLLSRVDMELGDSQWRQLFGQLARKRVKHIIWMPCGLLTLASLLVQVRTALAVISRGRRVARAGCLRTKKRMTDLFGDHYDDTDVQYCDDLPILGLTQRQCQ